MKTKTSLLTTMLIIASILNSTSITIANQTIRVPNPYPTIQAAINAAALGDTIEVGAQTYIENVVVNKTVSLIGEDMENTIIDGGGIGAVVNITANNVYISGFTIRNSGLGGEDFNSGVHVHFSNNTVITRNIIKDDEWGIRLERAHRNVISNNIIMHSVGNNAIYLGNSSRNTITSNTMTNNTYGVWLERSSSYNVIHGNTITNSSKGIRLGDNSDNNAVCGNMLKDNDEGVDLASSFNSVYENTLRDNVFGVSSVSSGEVDNVLYRNNFIENTIQVSLLDESLVKTWDNGLEGNYWSDYTGQDLNGDGIGDTPYQGFDRHPLIEPWSLLRIFNVTSDGENYVVTTLSNSTIARFNFNQSLAQIGFNVTGLSSTMGFCNLTVPKSLLHSEPPKNWTVTVDGVNVSFTLTENSTHTSLCFTYAHSTCMVRIRVAEVENTPPTADFTYSPANPTLYDTVNFTDISTDDGQVVLWFWEFGDGCNSSDQNPGYKYAEAGTYIVTLKVTDDGGAATMKSRGVSVRKVGTTLAIDAPSTANQGEQLTMTASLRDEKENFIPYATIEFYLLKQETWESIGYQETNASGAASITYTPLVVAGTYQFKALFNGTQILAESNVTFMIEIAEAAGTTEGFPWQWIAVGLAVVMTTTALAIVFVKRKRKPPSFSAHLKLKAS